MEQRTITLSCPGQNEVAYQAHAAIYEAIAARDPERSERVLREHLDQVVGLYWEVVGGDNAGVRDHRGLPAEAGRPGRVQASH